MMRSAHPPAHMWCV